MTQNELNLKLDQHEQWISTQGKKGKRLNFIKRELRGLNFSHRALILANFSQCDLEDCNFSQTDLRGTVFFKCDLQNTDFSYSFAKEANFSNSDLAYSILDESDFTKANFSNTVLVNVKAHYGNFNHADFNNARLDYSSFGLWCGSLQMHLDDAQIAQLAYHLLSCSLHSKNASSTVKNQLKNIINLGNQFDYKSRDLQPIKE